MFRGTPSTLWDLLISSFDDGAVGKVPAWGLGISRVKELNSEPQFIDLYNGTEIETVAVVRDTRLS